MSGIIFNKKWLYTLVGILLITISLGIYFYTATSEELVKKIIDYAKMSNINGLATLACDENDIISGTKYERAKALYNGLKTVNDLSYTVKDRFSYTSIYLIDNKTKSNVAYIVSIYQLKTNSFCFYRGVL